MFVIFWNLHLKINLNVPIAVFFFAMLDLNENNIPLVELNAMLLKHDAFKVHIYIQLYLNSNNLGLNEIRLCQYQ